MFDKIETFVADHETSVKIAAIAAVAGVGAYLGVRFGIKDLKVEMVLLERLERLSRLLVEKGELAALLFSRK